MLNVNALVLSLAIMIQIQICSNVNHTRTHNKRCKRNEIDRELILFEYALISFGKIAFKLYKCELKNDGQTTTQYSDPVFN